MDFTAKIGAIQNQHEAKESSFKKQLNQNNNDYEASMAKKRYKEFETKKKVEQAAQ